MFVVDFKLGYVFDVCKLILGWLICLLILIGVKFRLLEDVFLYLE